MIAMVLLILAAASSPAPAAPTVGVEGKVEIELPGSLLEAKPVTDKAPVLLRVATTKPAASPAAVKYDLRYMGLVSGEHDLKDYLVRADGSTTAGLPSIPVKVIGLLPPNHQGQLVKEDGESFPWLGGYRVMAALVGVLWVGGLISLVFVRRNRKREAEVSAPPAPPTFADRLRPLIDQAAAGALSVEDKARVERMLLWYWRRKLALDDAEPGAAIMTLRRDREAGELLRAMEGWLHRRPGHRIPEPDVAALLEPYRNAPDIAEAEVAA